MVIRGKSVISYFITVLEDLGKDCICGRKIWNPLQANNVQTKAFYFWHRISGVSGRFHTRPEYLRPILGLFAGWADDHRAAFSWRNSSRSKVLTYSIIRFSPTVFFLVHGKQTEFFIYLFFIRRFSAKWANPSARGLWKGGFVHISRIQSPLLTITSVKQYEIGSNMTNWSNHVKWRDLIPDMDHTMIRLDFKRIRLLFHNRWFIWIWTKWQNINSKYH